LERTEAPPAKGEKPMNEPSILSVFLGKTVVVECEPSFTVEGRLTTYQTSSKQTHEPFILILENGFGKHVLRGNFQSIKLLGVKD
jgi:hypothetical protein